MIIFSYYAGHDPAVCILKDGEIILNLEKERVSRIRHDFGMNQEFIDLCMAHVGISPNDVNAIALRRGDVSNLDPKKCTPIFEDSSEGGYWTHRKLGSRDIPEVHIHHHLAHAASALYTSPFRDAVIVTWDGMGDNVNTLLAVAKDGMIQHWIPFRSANIATWFRSIGLKNFKMPLSSPHDIGSQAGKVMALAAYGRRNAPLIQELQGEIALFHNMFWEDGAIVSERPGFNMSEDLSDTTSDRSQELAQAIQSIAEMYLTQLFKRAFVMGQGEVNLCYAGGVALNCVANTKAFNESGFQNIHIPPCANDGGLALGQALLVHHQLRRKPYTPSHFSPYRGPVYTEDRIGQALREAKLDESEIDVQDAGQEIVLKLLVDGEVVALFRGGSETGPRALGHRSIVCRPDISDARDYLNASVKQREWYRPFAPIVLKEWTDEIFEGPFPHSPYMATTAVIRAEWRDRLSAVCHVDGTTRPQVLERHHEPWLYDLLSRFRETTGIPAIVNTSFNLREPIVESPEDAIRTFLDMPIGHLYLDGRILSKRSANRNRNLDKPNQS